EEAMAILGKPNQAEGQSLLTEFGIHRVERHEVPRQPEETRFKLQVGDQNRLTRGLDIWELAQWKTVRSALMQACPTATFPSDWKFRKDKNQDWDQVYETICGLAETVVADKEASKWAAIEEEVIEYLEGASEWNPDHSIDPKNAKFPLISDMNGQWFYFAKLKGLQHVVKDSVKDASRKEIIDVLRDLGGETTVQPRLPVVDPKDQKSRRLPTRGNVWLIPKDRVEQ
ncbi:MAG: hypothetical protein QF675_10730, partial [SAR324 cluster bacterium]|nr:hypothetical protein [SAR324 cluster bacterium]